MYRLTTLWIGWQLLSPVQIPLLSAKCDHPCPTWPRHWDLLEKSQTQHIQIKFMIFLHKAGLPAESPISASGTPAMHTGKLGSNMWPASHYPYPVKHKTVQYWALNSCWISSTNPSTAALFKHLPFLFISAKVFLLFLSEELPPQQLFSILGTEWLWLTNCPWYETPSPNMVYDLTDHSL